MNSNFKINWDIIIANLLGRKFLLGVLGILISTILVCCTVIDAGTFETCFLGVLTLAIGGNVAQKFIPGKVTTPKSSTDGQDINKTGA